MRRPARKTLVLLAALVVVALAALAIVLLLRPKSALPYRYTESPAAFAFNYPEGWHYQIPQMGVLILAQPATFNGQPGPTLTIHRSTSLGMYGSLEAALDEYMQRGPLRPEHGWEMVGEIEPVTFKGLEALEVEVQGSEFEGWENLHARIIATQPSSLVIYLFVLAAPVDQWEASQPVLTSVLDSVELFE